MKLTSRPLATLLMWLSCLTAAGHPFAPTVVSLLSEEDVYENRESSESSEESVLDEIALTQAEASRWNRRHQGWLRKTVAGLQPSRIVRQNVARKPPLERVLPLRC